MPSVNLARLRLQALELSGLLEDSAAFQTSLHSLLEEHSHRLLRRGSSMAQRGALPAWDVPGLLIRELEAALLPAAGKNPGAALASAAAIWPSGKLEEKQLAAFLAGLARNPGGIRTLLLRWVKETDDPVVLLSLAEHTCPPIRNSNAVLFRSDVRAWLESSSPSQRRFGWMALRAWTGEKTSESIFAAFDLLPVVFAENDPEAMRLSGDLLVDLANGFPQETQGWLSELTSKSLQQGRRFLRWVLPRLPEETAAILRSLRKDGSTGG